MKNLPIQPSGFTKTVHSWGVAVLVLLSISSCQPSKAPSLDDTEAAAVVSEATDFLNDYYAATCKDGLSREFEFLDSSADFHWKPLGSERILTYDTVAAMVRRNISSIDTTCATWTELTVTAKAMDTAHYEGKLHAWTVTVDGDTISEDFEEMGNLIKRQGRWWLLNGETKAKL